MAGWSEGYVTDVQYTSQFYSEMAPGFLAFACLRQSVRPPALGAGSTYVELGCGQGFGLNLLAAANPQMRFWGVDFHPGQVDNARTLARTAGLANIAFEDFSFERVLELPDERLPQADVVALHGILSWINPENRGRVVRILDRIVKPGGLVYASYNCLPGWGPLVPVQRFLTEHVARSQGDPAVRVMAALKAAQAMIDAKAAAFQRPGMREAIEQGMKASPAYLVHEYLHGHQEPLFHADVAREFAEARLVFAASVSLADDLPHLAAPPEMQAQIRDAVDPTWRQTLLDYASDKSFRRDVFVRGRNELSMRERDAMLAQLRFALTGPPGQGPYGFVIPVGRITGDPVGYQAIVDALAAGPKSFAELSRLAAFAKAPEGVLLQAVTLLVGGRHIHPLPAEDVDAAPAQRFNRAVAARTAYDEFAGHLAAPAIGSGVRVEFTDLIALKAHHEKQADRDAIAATWAMMTRTGRRLVEDGEAKFDQAGNEAAMQARLARFREHKLPAFERLGVA